MNKRVNVGRKRSVPNKDIKVEKNAKLLEFLLSYYSGKSRSEVKSYLSHRQIAVNGRTQTHFDFELFEGDTVTYRTIGEERPNPNHKVRVVYEDDFILLVDKKCGVLSHSTKEDGTITAFTVMKEHVRRRGKENKLFKVHTLDRDVSGLLLFAKDEETQFHLQKSWKSGGLKRQFVAVVEGETMEPKGELVSYLTEDARTLKVQASSVNNGGNEAVMRYSVIKTNGQYTLVALDLVTDLKHQLRVQLQSIEHPIAGDKKYGAQTNPLGRLCLHFNYLEFIHPYTREIMKFDTGIPVNFK